MTPNLECRANSIATQTEQFDRLLRRAAACCWLEQFKREASKGDFVMGYNQIGEAAGNVWKALDEHRPQTTAELMEEVNAPQSLFFMAVGWLSREKKVRFEAGTEIIWSAWHERLTRPSAASCMRGSEPLHRAAALNAIERRTR